MFKSIRSRCLEKKKRKKEEEDQDGPYKIDTS